jgi:cystathionine beta-lyase
MSLVVPYNLSALRGMKNGEVPKHLVNGVLVRFSIGFEDVVDLQADLLQALAVLG